MELYQSMFCVAMAMLILFLGYLLVLKHDPEERERIKAIKTLEDAILKE